MLELLQALASLKKSRVERRTSQFRSRGQVRSTASMATVAVDGGDGNNPLGCLQ
jgi:hypothetical protein